MMGKLILFFSILCLSAIFVFGQKSVTKPRKFPIGKVGELAKPFSKPLEVETKEQMSVLPQLPEVVPVLNYSALTIISKPRPISRDYFGCVQGIIRLRVTFLENGEVGKIWAISTLPFRLTDDAIEAAARIKFLPAVQNGKRITVEKVIEYRFQWNWV
jgi:Gram-negative bacterial TonB protein C-terminal